MILFDGTYRLKANTDDRLKPRAKWAYAWRVRIINLSLSQPDLHHLRPYIVYISQTDTGLFKANCAESLGKTICRDFGLDINETIWLEYFPKAPGKIYAAIFTPKSSYGPELFYNIAWRPIRFNEIAVIKPFIPEIASFEIEKIVKDHL